jgi:D-alanyl-D-alanine carboxypeptidase
VRILTLVTLLALAVVAAGTASTTAFRGGVTAIGPERAAAMTGVSWRAGCPVSLRDLRLVTATYRDFSGRARTGWLVVHRDVAAGVLGVLRRLYAAGFPIRRMIPIDAYGGSDFRSIEADNTSAFNCRPVDGTNTWSEHAYGRAIDVNPIENPYVSGGRTSHPASVPYVDRVPCRKGMACPGNRLVAAFRAIGWGWGGDWSSARDYQHFSSSSR